MLDITKNTYRQTLGLREGEEIPQHVQDLHEQLKHQCDRATIGDFGPHDCIIIATLAEMRKRLVEAVAAPAAVESPAESPADSVSFTLPAAEPQGAAPKPRARRKRRSDGGREKVTE